MNNELKLCPFCGGKAATRSTLDTPARWFGLCVSCEIMTGYSTSEEGAVIVWNGRLADKIDDLCGIRGPITDDQFESLFVALHRIKCEPTMDEITLVMPEVVNILLPEKMR